MLDLKKIKGLIDKMGTADAGEAAQLTIQIVTMMDEDRKETEAYMDKVKENVEKVSEMLDESMSAREDNKEEKDSEFIEN